MERLTYWNKDAVSWFNHGTMGEVIDHLAAYEDTNLTPADINDLRNELCLKCGKYKDAYLGACDGCRWRKEEAGDENN